MDISKKNTSLEKLDWVSSVPFILIHLLSLGILFFEPTWELFALCVALYFLRMFGITAGFHRYFSHRSFKTSRVFQFILAWLGMMSIQKGVLWWASNHRHHHQHSDQEEDIHSPVQRSFLWSHMSWFLCNRYDQTQWHLIKDFAKYPELVWLNRFHIVPSVFLGAALVYFGSWAAFFWGFCLSTTLLWHGTYTINSLAHVFGKKRYQTDDESRNNFYLALITMGEGWHNNHHAYPSSAKQGFFWWEIDLTYYILYVLSAFGIVWDLRAAPLAELEYRRI